jgi:putative flavoprotein involved in K+ transport
MTSASGGSPLDVLVIGGGQAGLAIGYELARRSTSFQIVDAGEEIGEAWRSRWDSLRLFTPAQYDGLPGLAFPAERDTYPGKDEVADYLRTYATTFQLPVAHTSRVTSLTTDGGRYFAKAGASSFEARRVVVATGPFQVPSIPSVADGLDPAVHQIHSVDYRNPAALPAGRVLVVGGANSGCQIAHELSATRSVELSVGKRLPTIPQRPLGRDVWWWATGVGLDRVTGSSRLGKRLSQRDQVIGIGPRQLARRHDVRIRPRVSSATGRSVTFADGATAEFDTVVWASGFRVDHTWIDVPSVKDGRGGVEHTRGVTSAAGLYMLGLTWQQTRGSALLGWVGRDAAFLAERIASS